jgi:hypothetical protein
MSNEANEICGCNPCTGAGCACGCQNPATQDACACGPQCACGSSCACGEANE